MKRIEYKIKGYMNQEDRPVAGYRIDLPRADGNGVVSVCTRKQGQSWVVDHLGTGASLSTFGGATRKEAIQLIKSRFAEYEDRILHAESFMDKINAPLVLEAAT